MEIVFDDEIKDKEKMHDIIKKEIFNAYKGKKNNLPGL